LDLFCIQSFLAGNNLVAISGDNSGLDFQGTLRHHPSIAALRPETLPGIGRVKRKTSEGLHNFNCPHHTPKNILIQTVFCA
jgi:hypothetical protein